MVRYCYSPLPPGADTFRILSLHPGTKDDPISCELITARLSPLESNDTTFEAPSYCWGDASNCLPIRVGAGSLLVTRNLHAALQHLRRPWGPPRRIWADAVCINQDDATEKGGQVQMMRDIYRGASHTVV